MVAAGQDARAGRRAQRRRVHVGVQQAVRGELVDVGRPDRRAEAAELPEAGIVDHDEQHVGGTRPGANRLRPRGLGLADRPADDAGERGPGLVLEQIGARGPREAGAHRGRDRERGTAGKQQIAALDAAGFRRRGVPLALSVERSSLMTVSSLSGCSGSPGGWSRCRPAGRGARPAGSAGSSWARTGASRP